MASQLQPTIIESSSAISLPVGTTAQRPGYTAIQWTNTGSQAYSVLAGATPTLTNTSWTAPTGVTQVEVLVVAGGGSGGYPTVTKWETGLARSVANTIDDKVTWKSLNKLVRGKANTLL